MCEREVPLVAFEDPRWRWRTRKLLRRSEGWRGRESEAEEDAQDAPAAADPVALEDLGGVFRFEARPEYSEGDNAACERRMIVWRALAREGALEVLEISLDGDLQDCAVRFQLPRLKRVADGGVTWMENKGRLVLCVCFSDGDAATLYFRNHPFTTDEARRCFPARSVLSDKGEGSLLSVMHQEEIKSVGACCWFTDAHEMIHLATGPDRTDAVGASTDKKSAGRDAGSGSAGPPPITCTCFPNSLTPSRSDPGGSGAGGGAKGSGEYAPFELTDTSLTQRLWTGLLKRSTGTADASASRVEVVQLRSLRREQSENDETFLFAIYSDGKARVWSVSRRACRNEIDLLAAANAARGASASAGASAPAPTGAGHVEQAWIECRLGGVEDTFGTKRKLTLAVALRMSSARPVVLALDGWLAINNINLETTVRDILGDAEVKRLRGFRMVDLVLEDAERARSVWWRPTSGQSTMTIKHAVSGAGAGAGAETDHSIPYQLDRKALLEADAAHFEAQQDAFSPEGLVKQCVARVDLPGRFSTLDLCEGLASSFGSKAVRGMDAERGADGEVPRSAVVDLAERMLRVRLFQDMDSSEDAVVLCKRLIDDCEHAWLQGHRPLRLGATAMGEAVIVRRSGAFSFRPADWSEAALFESEAAADVRDLARAASALRLDLVRLEGRYAQSCASPSRLADLVNRHVDAVDTDALEEALEPLLARWTDPESFFSAFGAVLSKLAPPRTPRQSRSRGQAQALPGDNFVDMVDDDDDDVDDDDATTLMDTGTSDAPPARGPRRTIEVEMRCAALQQTLHARSRLALAVLVLGACVTQGVPGLTISRDFFGHPAARPLVKRAAHVCVSLMLAQLLGRVRPCSETRSMEWLRRLTLVAPKGQAAGPLREDAASVLGLWVDRALGGSTARASEENDALVARLCDIQGELLPFADREQQYEVLGVLAHFVLEDGQQASGAPSAAYARFYPGHPGDCGRYTRLLLAKARLWALARRGSTSSSLALALLDEENVGDAVELFHAATPADEEAQRAYYISVMKLFEHAREPREAINFALRALQLGPGASSRSDHGVLCARLFALALDANVRDYKVALSAARLYPRASEGPDGARVESDEEAEGEGDKYIGQLVSTLVERGEVRALCELPFQCYSEKTWKDVVMRTLERKTQEETALPKYRGQTTCFHTLFTFCIHHARFHEAAMCMYELAERIRVTVQASYGGQWNLSQVQTLQDALSSCLMALRLIPDGNATLFIRSADAGCESRTLAQVEAQFAVAAGAVRLLTVRQSGEVRLDATALVPALLDAGLADTATDLIVRFKMDATPVFEYLSLQCLHGKQPWSVLQRQLKVLDKLELGANGERVLVDSYRYHLVVLETLLRAKPDLELPQWLQASFLWWGNFARGKQSPDDHVFTRPAASAVARAPAAQLRVLIAYDRLADALALAADVVQVATYYSGGSSPLVLPIKTLDVLMTRAERQPGLAGDLDRLKSALAKLAAQSDVNLGPF